MSKEVEQVIVEIHDFLHRQGHEVSGTDAAKVFTLAMESVMKHVKDPRELGGAVVGPGGPFDFGSQVIDARRAILPDYQEVAKVDPETAGDNDETFAFLFSGRINRTPDRASVMLLGGIDFMATTITECHGVAERAGLNDKLIAACQERWAEMPHPE